MFKKRIPLFRLFGFDIRVHSSWFIILALVAWSLAQGLFPAYYHGHSTSTYWTMGIAAALGLFASIVLHELCHSLVARKSGMKVEGITLFLFGGVSELHEEPKDAKSELIMAAVGPMFSLVFAVVLYLVYWLAVDLGVQEPVSGVIAYLALMNLVLGLFNMVPAFPLDGGRVLRALLWKTRGNLVSATRTASRIGVGFGFVLIFLGVVSLFAGNFIGGIWWCLIGMLLQGAANETYQQLIIRQSLGKLLVRDLMNVRPVTVPPSIKLSVVAREFFARKRILCVPVVENEKVLGVLRTRDIRAIPRAEWENETAGEKSKPLGPENSVGPGASAHEALQIMRRYGNDPLLVVQGDSLEGTLSMSEILKALSLSLELGIEDLPPGPKIVSPHERQSA